LRSAATSLRNACTLPASPLLPVRLRSGISVLARPAFSSPAACGALGRACESAGCGPARAGPRAAGHAG
jgi:hypothetical protein